jgi:hypothetical protein
MTIRPGPGAEDGQQRAQTGPPTVARSGVGAADGAEGTPDVTDMGAVEHRFRVYLCHCILQISHFDRVPRTPCGACGALEMPENKTGRHNGRR